MSDILRTKSGLPVSRHEGTGILIPRNAEEWQAVCDAAGITGQVISVGAGSYQIVPLEPLDP